MPGLLLALCLGSFGLRSARGDELVDTANQCRGREHAGEFCWVPTSTTSMRSCACVINACPATSVSETTDCFICDRGEHNGQGWALPRSAAGCQLQAPCPTFESLHPAHCTHPPSYTGYGVYASEDECMASAAEVDAIGIDSASYPAPTFPPTLCPANSRATGNVG